MQKYTFLEGEGSESIDIYKAIEQIRAKLLDLTARNRFIKFKHTRRSLRFVNVALDDTFSRLLDGKSVPFSYVELPTEEEEGMYPTVKDFAASKGMVTSYELPYSGSIDELQLQTLLYPKDFDRTVRIIRSESRTAVEESGNHTLFLVYGFLRYSLSTQPDGVTYDAPLLLLPVRLEKGDVDPCSGLHNYTLMILDEEEEARDNLTLREKLNRELGFQLPVYDSLQKPSEYLEAVSEACGRRKGWKVLPHLSLVLLSFKNIALWSDFDLETDQAIIHHPLIKKLFGWEGQNESISECSEEEYTVDEHPLADIPLVYDADSSQHSALIDALEGKNLVVIGPPGTGKSQTITNLITAAMGRGKRVLFISEKKAALEVVSKRIEKAGLGSFCLELHSNKSNKRRILDSLDQRINENFSLSKQDSAMDLESLKEMRSKLNSYAKLINQNAELPEGLTIHDVLWKIEELRGSLKDKADELQSVFFENALFWDASALRERRKAVNELRLHHQALGQRVLDHPMQGIYITSLSPIDKNRLREFLEDGETNFSDLLNMLIPSVDNKDSVTVSEQFLALHQAELALLSSPVDISLEGVQESIQSASQDEIQLALHLTVELIANLDLANPLLKKDIEEFDTQLSGTSLDDQPICNLNELSSEVTSVLAQSNSFYPSSLIEDMSKLMEAFSFNKRIKPLSLHEAEKLLGRLDSLFQKHLNSNCLSQKSNEVTKDQLNSDINALEDLVFNLSNKIGQFHCISTSESVESNLSLLQTYTSILDCAPELFFSLQENKGALNSSQEFEVIVKEAKELFAQKQELEKWFKLECLPSSNELESYLKTISDPSLYSFFSPRFRLCKKLCVSLFHKKPAKSEILVLLKRLFNWVKNCDGFLSCPIRKAVFGDYIGASNQNQKELEEFFAWWDLADNRLSYFNAYLWSIPTEIIENFESSKMAVSELLDEQCKIKEALGSLSPYYQELKELVKLAKPVVAQSSMLFKEVFERYEALMKICASLRSLGFIASQPQSLGEIQELLRTHSEQVTYIVDRYRSLAPSSATARQINRMIDAQKNVKKLVETAKTNTILVSWMEYSKPNSENLKGLERFLQWAVQVRRSNIIPSLQSRLIRNCFELKTVATLIDKKVSCIQSLKSHLEEVTTFCVIDKSRWALPDKAVSLDGLQEIRDRFRQALKKFEDLEAWITYNQAAEAVQKYGLGCLTEKLEQNFLEAGELSSAFDYIYYRSCVHYLYQKQPNLPSEIGYSLEDTRTQFAQIDRKIIQNNGKKLAADIARAEVPEGRRSSKVREQTNLVLLKHEINKTRRHLPIRKLMSQAGEAIQALKPCFLMSPLSVAQYLPKGVLDFDLLIIDEASQMRMPEAFGAVLRSKQMVVVGDPKQLPPSSFFTKNDDSDDEEEEDIATVSDGVQSILERCLQVFKSPRSLRWHYRSQHQNLIAFSNYHFYENRLIILPARLSGEERAGVYYNYIADATYSDRSNRKEAEELIEAVVRQLVDSQRYSVGIVALNQPQKELLAELFEQKLRENPSLVEVVDQFKSDGEDVFIKNLENVQGDERDIIFISTVYGKAPGTSTVRQTFGPINGEMGWRRLNVLFTRSRRRIELYTSMQPEDVVVNEKSSFGHKILKHYLAFAKDPKLTAINPPKGEVESPFEAAIVDLLERNGYETHPQLGVSGYSIDIGVYHPEKPGEFLAAIECDGATYHSSRSARDRDRIRQEILESLGWRNRIHRIWSTDWFVNPLKQSNRLLDFLALLRFPEESST